MESFIILTFIVFLFGLIRENSNQKTISPYLFTSLLFLCLITGLRRYDIGNDTESYYRFFDNIAYGSFDSDERIELGFRYLSLFLSMISKDYTVFLIITSAILFGTMYKYIRDYGYNSKLYVCIFWCFAYISFVSPLRQSLGLCLVLWAIPFLVNGKVLIFALACYAAHYFHNSAIVCLAILPLAYFEPKKNRVLWVVILIALLVASGGASIFSDYLDDEYYRRYLAVQSGWIAAVFNAVFAVIPILLDKGDIDNSRTEFCSKFSFYNIMKWSSVLYASSYLLSIHTSGMGRIAYYFLPMMLSYWVYTIENISGNNKKLLIAFVFIVLIGYKVTTLLLRPEWNSFFPFYFYWQ